MQKKVGRKVDYGQGCVELDVDSITSQVEKERRAENELLLSVQRAIESDDFQPPLLPEVAVSLSELAGRPQVDFKEVEAVVSRDPAVAAKIVAVANSAFFSRGTPIKSLGLAITRLGLAAVRDVAFQVVAQAQIFRVPGYSARMRDMFEAAQMGGVLAREICRVLRFESEMAYLCGLLHDMGEAILLGLVGNMYKYKGQKPPSLDSLSQVIDKFHARVGAKVCTAWGLPSLISNAIFNHHNPDESNDTTQMATVVALVDLLLGHVGIGTDPHPVDPMQEPLFYKVNLMPNQVTALINFTEQLSESSVSSAN